MTPSATAWISTIEVWTRERRILVHSLYLHVLVSDSLELGDAYSFQSGLRHEHLVTKGKDGALEGKEVSRDKVDF